MEQLYCFHWSNGETSLPAPFDDIPAAWDVADDLQLDRDAELTARIDAVHEQLCNAASKSERLELGRKLRELQSDYENAPVVDCLVAVDSEGNEIACIER